MGATPTAAVLPPMPAPPCIVEYPSAWTRERVEAEHHQLTQQWKNVLMVPAETQSVRISVTAAASVARALLAEFLADCAARGVELHPHQRAFAEAAIASDAMRQFFMGGLASGRTFVTEQVEWFFDRKRRGEI